MTIPVIPAQAGNQSAEEARRSFSSSPRKRGSSVRGQTLDSRLRGNDGAGATYKERRALDSRLRGSDGAGATHKGGPRTPACAGMTGLAL